MKKQTMLATDQNYSFPTPYSIRCDFAASSSQLEYIAKCRKQVHEILEGKDSRKLIICGPCSIHDMDSAIEYAERLRQLAVAVKDRFFIIMRTYFDKPRTTLGWPGFATDPHLDGSDDIPAGITLTRKLLLRLTEMQVPTAAEFLNPLSSHYFGDLLSWGCIGARTAESQTHRQIAAGLPLPIAFKNSTSGSIQVAINGAIAASYPHTFLGIDHQGQLAILKAEGNRSTHIVLRGSDSHPNYYPESINDALELLKKAQIPSRLIVDCAHGNSQRQHEKQRDVFRSTISQIALGNQDIRGLILESHINGGNQPLPSESERIKYGVSITDPCLDWEATEHLIRWGHETLN
jgi:3-deoxy-7-phosphoheptulonate synthase